MSALKSGLMLLTGATIGAIAVLQGIKTYNGNKQLTATIDPEPADKPSEAGMWEFYGTLTSTTTKPFKVLCKSGFAVHVTMYDNGQTINVNIDSGRHSESDILNVLSIKDIRPLIDAIGYDNNLYYYYQTRHGWSFKVTEPEVADNDTSVIGKRATPLHEVPAQEKK